MNIDRRDRRWARLPRACAAIATVAVLGSAADARAQSIPFAATAPAYRNTAPTADASASIAAGWEAVAGAEGSVAVGQGAIAGLDPDDTYGTAIGFESTAHLFGTAVGAGSFASADEATALGAYTSASNAKSTAVGGWAIAYGASSTAIGGGFTGSNAEGSISIGMLSYAGRGADGGVGAIAIGAGSEAEGVDTIALGRNVIARGLRAISIGTGADAGVGAFGAEAEDSFALGYGAVATGVGSIAMGSGSAALEDNVVSVGRAAGESYGRTELTRRIVNLTDGRLSATSTDAVTGRQLFSIRESLIAGLGGGAGFDGAGAFIAPSYSILGSTYRDLGGALAALDTQVGANTTDVGALKNSVSGPPASNHDTEIAALRAQVQALTAALDRLERTAIGGGDATGEGATAAGTGAVAAQFGDTAYGAGARATGDPSTAIGYAAVASGQHSSALGGNAEATGDLSLALGQAASAGGARSVAVGQSAIAAHDNAVAIGQGVTTSRPNQVALGSAQHTYTLAGVHSQASRQAQSGSTYVVTADAAGNLATLDMNPWFDRIDGFEGRLEASDGRWRQAGRTFERHADGLAVAMALGGAQVLQPGQSFSISANLGHFDGANAFGFGAIGRLNHNVSINVGAGAGFQTGVAAGRAGIAYGW